MISPIPINELHLAYETISQLRTHLSKEEFIARVNEELKQGYILVGIKEDEKYVALAGYRYSLNLFLGNFLYCDDLIVHEKYRGKGLGDKLMKFMYKEATKNNCDSFQLDSGVQRFGAHRLYIKNQMDITCHHFSRNVEK